MTKLISTGVAISATSRKDSRHCWLCYRRMFSSLLAIAFDRLVPFSTLSDTAITRPDVTRAGLEPTRSHQEIP